MLRDQLTHARTDGSMEANFQHLHTTSRDFVGLASSKFKSDAISSRNAWVILFFGGGRG